MVIIRSGHGDFWRCPDFFQHRVVELEKRVAELEAEIEARGPVAVTKRVTPDQHKIAELERALTQSRIDAHAMRDQKDRDMDLVTSRLEAKLHEAQERELALRETLQRLTDEARDCSAVWRLDEHISNADEALSNTTTTAQEIVARIERDTRKAIWDAVKDMWGASPMQFRAAILGEKEQG
jgi:hypothetical protein